MPDAQLERAEVIATYTRLARYYDLWCELAESKARRRCLDLAAIQSGEAVLEVAVGTGLVFAEILALNRDGINEGIDLTEPMLARARAKAKQLGVHNYRLQVGDTYDLEFSDESFDVVVNNYMFDLLPEGDFPRILGEFKRVLRPRGRLSMASMTRPIRWTQKLWELLYRMSPSLMGGCRGVELLPYVISAGFTNTRREIVSQLTFPSEVIYAVKPR